MSINNIEDLGRPVANALSHPCCIAIGISGAIGGIAWSLLAYYLACLSNRNYDTAEGINSVGARAAFAIFLAAIALVAADLKSRFPRLTTGCLLSVFTAIWLLAITTSDRQVSRAS